MGKWFTSQLMWVANINKGSTLTSAEMKEGEIPVVAGGMSCCGYHNVFNRKGNVITISASGANAGNVQFYDKPIFATDCSTIYSSEQSNKYLFYWLQYKQKNIYKMQSGLAQPHVYPKDLAKMVLTLPEERREQEKIAEILGEVDKAIDSTKKLIDKYSLIKEGILQDLLTNGIDENGKIRSEATHKYKDSPMGRIPVEWECVKLEEIADKIADRDHTTPNYVRDGIPIVSPKDFDKFDNIDFSNCAQITLKEHLNNCRKTDIKIGDLIFTRIGAGLGKVCMVNDSMPEFSILHSAALIRVNSKNDGYYIMYSIKSFYFQKLINDGIQSIGVPDLGIDKIYNLLIKVPKKKEEQEEISKRIKAIFEAIQQNDKCIKKLQLQKQALMQDLLSNKVSVDCLL